MRNYFAALGLALVVSVSSVASISPARAAEKYDAGTLEGRGATAVTNVGALPASLQGKPVVVNIHADWCPACRQTEPVLDEIKKHYGGKVNFVTFDVTNARTAAVAAETAKADGLTRFFDATKAATSTVAVIDPTSGNVVAEFYNDIEAADYRKAIEKAFVATK